MLLIQQFEGRKHLNSAEPVNVWILTFRALMHLLHGIMCLAFGLELVVALFSFGVL